MQTEASPHKGVAASAFGVVSLALLTLVEVLDATSGGVGSDGLGLLGLFTLGTYSGVASLGLLVVALLRNRGRVSVRCWMPPVAALALWTAMNAWA